MECLPSYTDELYLAHHGIKGQRWGIRRFQNFNGTRTLAGKRRERENNADRSKNDRLKSRLKKGAIIAGGVLATAAVGYALYKTGAGEKAINYGRNALSGLLNKKSVKDATPADFDFSINPTTGKKVSAPKPSGTNLTESGASLKVPIKKSATSSPKISTPKANAPKASISSEPMSSPKVTSSPKSSGTNLTESGASLKVPIRRSPARNVVNSSGSTPVSKAKTTPAKRKVAMKVIMDNADQVSRINSRYDDINDSIIGFTDSMINQSRR